ncbi:MAG: two pore domain potassium channel family protein [Alphaproteobacteria bacterium]|nr:two pore domain potassium channel family protein [Alphaproteobacteria bacterium]
MAEIFMWFIASLLVIVTVCLHYETMSLVSDKIVPWAQKHSRGRRVIAVSIAGLMLGHIAEIWVFALVIMLLVHFPYLGSVQGSFNPGLGDFLYLSSVDYTSLGDNDMRLTGPIRALASTETLAGMLMIGWSASFTYLKMEQIWKISRSK